MSKTGISWTDETINPIVGCSKCSPGCDNCYAEDLAKRWKAAGVPQYQDVVDENGWNGKTCFAPKAFDRIPKRDPKKIFIGSMTDIFHESVPFEWIDKIMLVVNKHRQHTFQILTKRPERMKKYFDERGCLGWYGAGKTYTNLWLGVTVCNQEEYNKNNDLLAQCPAKLRFISFEPLLGAIDMRNGPIPDWVICGGESGRNARPLNPDWVISLRDQCQAANVPFFFKQWGEYEYDRISQSGYIFDPKLGCNRTINSDDLIIGDYVYRKNKKSGNHLQGEIYEQFPGER